MLTDSLPDYRRCSRQGHLARLAGVPFPLQLEHYAWMDGWQFGGMS